MKVDKDALAVYAVIGGLVACIPFIGIYEVGKWLYKHAPWELKKRKKLDEEIHQLEEKLGIVEKFSTVLDYDPYYYKQNRSRKEYWETLKIK